KVAVTSLRDNPFRPARSSSFQPAGNRRRNSSRPLRRSSLPEISLLRDTCNIVIRGNDIVKGSFPVAATSRSSSIGEASRPLPTVMTGAPALQGGANGIGLSASQAMVDQIQAGRWALEAQGNAVPCG